MVFMASVASPVASAQTVAPAYAVFPTQNYCPQLSYNLYRGLSDARTAGQVSQLQYFLGAYFAAEPVPVTGFFGPITYSYVARFQREQSVYPVTGGVGPLTRAAIARNCTGTTAPPPTTGIFYLNTPFSLSAGAQAKEYQGQLDFTLNKINLGFSYPWSTGMPLSASITLGQSCAAGTYCIAALWYPQQTAELTQGQSLNFQGYTVTLLSLTNGSATFIVTKEVVSTGMSVTAPATGQTVARGGVLPITWESSLKVAGSVLVDLYTASGSKVGTVAIQSYNGNGSYSWTVPVPNTVCTMQYPNALCGQSLSGTYFVKVSIVSGSGFDSTQNTFASANSGAFTVY